MIYHEKSSAIIRRSSNVNEDKDQKRKCAIQVVEECFWGDYLLTADDLLARLEKNEPGFDTFIFSKIIENSSFPSRHLVILFPPETLQPLLNRYLGKAGHKRRIRIVAANLTGRYELVPELQWSK